MGRTAMLAAALLAVVAPQSASVPWSAPAPLAAPDSPVADAAMRGDADAVRSLVARGEDVNQAQGDGMTALHWAARNPDASLVRFLLEAGADVGAETRIGPYTPLHLAARAGAGKVTELLLGAGADPNAATRSSGGARPLHFAAEAGDARTVEALLDAGADPNAAETAWGQTPLIFAASAGRTAAVRSLLAAGADLSAATKVIDVAERAVADRIERAERNQRIKAGERWDPAMAKTARTRVQAERQQSEARRALAEAASREEAQTRMIEEPEPLSYGELVGGHGGLTALLHAAREGHAETAWALLDGGAEIDQTSAGDGTSPMLMAVINGHFDLAMRFLDRGADPNNASRAGAAPLFAVLNTHWAPKSRYPQQHVYMQQDHTYLEAMRKLLAAGADPNARLAKHLWFMSFNFDLLQIDAKGATPFWRAAYALDVEAMKLLVEHGADPSIPTEKVPSRRYGRGGEEVDHSGLPPVPVGGARSPAYPRCVGSRVRTGVRRQRAPPRSRRLAPGRPVLGRRAGGRRERPRPRRVQPPSPRRGPGRQRPGPLLGRPRRRRHRREPPRPDDRGHGQRPGPAHPALSGDRRSAGEHGGRQQPQLRLLLGVAVQP